MPNLGPTEFIVIILILVILFGWKKLPDAARSLGRSMRIFKAEVEEMKEKPSAASRDTVQAQARHEAPRHGTTSETLRPEDHRVDDAATRPAPQQSPVQETVTGEQDPQYRPPMA